MTRQKRLINKHVPLQEAPPTGDASGGRVSMPTTPPTTASAAGQSFTCGARRFVWPVAGAPEFGYSAQVNTLPDSRHRLQQTALSFAHADMDSISTRSSYGPRSAR